MGARAGIELALKWLTTKDSLERKMLEELYEKISKKREIMDHNLAVDIANQVGKLFSK